ncbi:MAG TPA: TerB family tellurite resistance protein [Gammaproteobacteria bacterium]|nr:TerB family tellurite resistance protein [Gammaproteobacteria bacterium]
MLAAIRRFFEDRLSATSLSQQSSEQRLQLATAALLLEVARADQAIHKLELTTVEQAIARTFQLSADAMADLVRLAEEEVRQSTSDYAFTSLVNKGFELADKVRLIELLWEVAYADGELDKYEEHLIRRIAELIYVPHQEFIAAKLRVAEKVG